MFRGLAERGMNGVRGAIGLPVALFIGMLVVDGAFLAYSAGMDAWTSGGADLVPDKTAAELGKTKVKDLLPNLYINPIEQPLGVWVSAAAGGATIGLLAKPKK